MKEFGVYIVKREYLDKFKCVENKLSQLKIPNRPFICVKLGNSKTNWLIPLSSINPESKEYLDRFRKQKHYNYLDNQNPPKAMDIYDNLLGKNIRGFKDVVQYYNAIPIKHKYCEKFRNEKGAHIVLDKEIGTRIKKRSNHYISYVKNGKLTGFIKHFVSKGNNDYKLYPINFISLTKALYEDHYKKIYRDKLHKQSHQENREIKEHKKELKKSYKRLTEKEQVVQISQFPAVEKKAIENVGKQQTQQPQQFERVQSITLPSQRSEQPRQQNKRNQRQRQR